MTSASASVSALSCVVLTLALALVLVTRAQVPRSSFSFVSIAADVNGNVFTVQGCPPSSSLSSSSSPSSPSSPSSSSSSIAHRHHYHEHERVAVRARDVEQFSVSCTSKPGGGPHGAVVLRRYAQPSLTTFVNPTAGVFDAASCRFVVAGEAEGDESGRDQSLMTLDTRCADPHLETTWRLNSTERVLFVGGVNVTIAYLFVVAPSSSSSSSSTLMYVATESRSRHITVGRLDGSVALPLYALPDAMAAPEAITFDGGSGRLYMSVTLTSGGAPSLVLTLDVLAMLLLSSSSSSSSPLLGAVPLAGMALLRRATYWPTAADLVSCLAVDDAISDPALSPSLVQLDPRPSHRVAQPQLIAAYPADDAALVCARSPNTLFAFNDTHGLPTALLLPSCPRAFNVSAEAWFSYTIAGTPSPWVRWNLVHSAGSSPTPLPTSPLCERTFALYTV